MSVANESECLERIQEVMNERKNLTDQDKEEITQGFTIEKNKMCFCGSSNRGACHVRTDYRLI